MQGSRLRCSTLPPFIEVPTMSTGQRSVPCWGPFLLNHLHSCCPCLWLWNTLTLAWHNRVGAAEGHASCWQGHSVQDPECTHHAGNSLAAAGSSNHHEQLCPQCLLMCCLAPTTSRHCLTVLLLPCSPLPLDSTVLKVALAMSASAAGSVQESRCCPAPPGAPEVLLWAHCRLQQERTGAGGGACPGALISRAHVLYVQATAWEEHWRWCLHRRCMLKGTRSCRAAWLACGPMGRPASGTPASASSLPPPTPTGALGCPAST